MYIDADTIIKAGEVITALGVIGGVLVNMFKQYSKQKQMENDIKEMKEELSLLTEGILNCLKTMQGAGFNGPVTEFTQKVEKYLNKKAHDMT